MSVNIVCSPCLEWMQTQPADSVDLVFGSPPYEAARTYGIGFNLRGEDWVRWMIPIVVEAVRICRGLVAINCEGQTRNYRYSAVPILLAADLHRMGLNLRKPVAFHRSGIPGSGGPDWLRNDWEFVLCATKPGRLPWSDPTACGQPPKYQPGGAMSNRITDGRRCNITRKRDASGVLKSQGYISPSFANPGNVVRCKVGGGHMGSSIAVQNEAPFPLALAEFFVRSFCPPGGVVYDPFGGSGTTAHAAVKWGRNAVLTDVRESQCELARRRLADVQRMLPMEGTR